MYISPAVILEAYFSTGEVFEGGQTVRVDAPIDYMPVFEAV